MGNQNIYLPEFKNDFDSYNKKRRIKTEIFEQSRDTIEINLINLNYKDEKYKIFKKFLIIIIFFLFYANFLTRVVFVDISLLCLSLLLVCQTFKLIKKDSISFYGGLAFRTETTYFLNLKSSFFLPTEYIFDAVINEVIENLSVKYILVIRTKKEIYKQKPIIPVLISLEPSIQCLEIIYPKLREKILQYNEFSAKNNK